MSIASELLMINHYHKSLLDFHTANQQDAYIGLFRVRWNFLLYPRTQCTERIRNHFVGLVCAMIVHYINVRLIITIIIIIIIKWQEKQMHCSYALSASIQSL